MSRINNDKIDRKVIMKKLGLMIMFFVVLSIPEYMEAQHYVYHNVGDTIYGRDTIYHYQWWYGDWLNNDHDHNHKLLVQRFPGGLTYYGGSTISDYLCTEVMRYCYTPTPINIIGIAGAVIAYCPWDQSADSTDAPEYFRLYDACVDSFPLKADVRWRASDPHRYMYLPVRTGGGGSCCHQWHTSSYVVPIYEYYFEDKPITVTDSFYVGTTAFSNGWRDESTNLHINCQMQYYTIGFHYQDEYTTNLDCTDSNCVSSPLHLYKSRHHSISVTNHDWFWGRHSQFMLVFPIVELDTSFAHHPPDTTPYVCPEIENARLNAVVDDIAIVMWNSNSEYLHAEVSYGPSGIQPGEGTVLTTVNSNPFLQLPGIDSCTHYVAYVRALCDHEDSIYYSGWSDSISIYNCHTNTGGGDEPDPQGIDEVGAMAQLTHLIPNPATNQLQIACGFRMKQVELYDAQGRRVMQQVVDGVTAMVNLEGLETGTYIVLIRTQQGQLITKRLVKR